MKFFTSDMHFGHKNIIRFCDRPFKDLEHMREMLIHNWNQVVSPEDEVYHLGDFSFTNSGPTQEIISRLNGKIHGIWGNHDEGRNLVHLGFVSMYQHAELRLAKDITVKLNHFPYSGDHEDQGERYPELRPKRDDDSKWLLHGHVHGMWKIKPEEKMINMGCDVWDYKPVNADKIIHIIRSST